MRQTGKWDRDGGVMFSVRDRNLSLGDLHDAFVDSALARDLARQGVLGGEAPTCYPVFSPTGEHLSDVIQPQAQSLIDRGLATWIKPERHAVGLWMVPLDERPSAAPSDPDWAAKHTPSLTDVFGQWARLLRPNRAEVLIVAASEGRSLATIAQDSAESHFFLAAAALVNLVREQVESVQEWSRIEWALLARDWLSAVRAGEDPGPALWRVVDHPPIHSSHAAG
ncbi:MAG: hypothetical protein ACP5QO_14495 [Clostridia bacterium]